MKKTIILSLLLVLAWVGTCLGAVYDVTWTPESETCTIVCDGSTDFVGSTDAATEWTKGGLLKAIIWTVPAVGNTVSFRTKTTTGPLLAPTITMEAKSGVLYMNEFCFPVLKGTEFTDGSVITLKFKPRK